MNLLNKIGKIPEKIDGGIMYLAEKTAHAYNWTTGKTKADLANKMLSIAPIFEVTGGFLYSPVLGLIMLPVALTASHASQTLNNLSEKMERNAAEKGALDSRVEVGRELNAFMGYLFLMSSGVWCNMSRESYLFGDESSISGMIIAGGCGIRAFSHFVARTKYIPPRKNCVKRGIKKLKRLAEKTGEGLRKPEPASVPVSCSDYGLYEYFDKYAR